MNKKVYITDDKLLEIKKALAEKGQSFSSCNDKPPYEKDEYVIGGEGGNNDFFHVNESYGFSKNVDLSEIGRVNYTWDFDDDYYLEWLEDNEFADGEYIKLQYIKEGNVEFELDFCDNQTYHTIGSDSVYYDDLEILFGERMADTILRNCIEDGEGYFDTEELYYDDNIDINNPSELDSMAMNILRHGEYYKDCRGFILSNGVVIYTDMEHNEVTRIPGINDKFQFITLGNIRVLDHSIDIGKEPTRQQWEALKQVLRYYDGEELYLDIFYNNAEIGVHYPVCNPNYVFGEITRFYSEGIKPQGGSFYEGKQVVKENTFEKWFDGSVLVDEDGKPIKMYHGTGEKFDAFNKDFIGSTGAFEGYGFNFTPYYSTAAHYNPEHVIEAYLRVEHPMSTKTNNITLRQLINIIKEIDNGKHPTETIVSAYESPRYGEKWDETYYRRALPIAAKTIYQYNKENDYGDAGLYAEICLNGQADAKKVIDVFEKLGFDSVMHYNDNGKLQTVVVFEPNQIKLTSNKTYNNNSEIMSENIESEVEANQVKLDSFKKRNELAPKIWDGDKLNSRVRLKLLDIADDFWESVNISWVKPKGIILTGSICNFNWSKYSDIDLHIQVDFSEIDDRKDFVQEYFNGKKNEWNNEHSNLKIFGFQVELYVEDIDATTESGGIYDLEENDWIKKPSGEEIKSIGLDKYKIKDKSAEIMTDIDNLKDAFNKTDDDVSLRKIGRKSHLLRQKIKRMRKFGLERGGESDSFNIIYKVLRRTGYLDKLYNLSSLVYDKYNSISESIKEGVDENHAQNLYEYLKWAKTATDAEKASDFAKRYPDVTLKYIDNRSRDYDDFDKMRNELMQNPSLIETDSFIDYFGKKVEEFGMLESYLYFSKIQINLFNKPTNKIPTWMYITFNRMVNNEWCIHFCNNADAIASEGFKWGTSDISNLSFTGAGNKKDSEGYNFAFPIGEYSINSNSYGSFDPNKPNERNKQQQAVIFQTSGVEVTHIGDGQKQVIFWRGDAKNIIPIKFDVHDKTWFITDKNGQIAFRGRPSEILNWVIENSHKVLREEILKNGSLMDYITLLKEEVVADGNADHNPFKQRWKHERETLINYLLNYGELMTSKENGKQYKVLFDEMLSNRIGFNYCLCIQWNPITMEPGNVIYVRAYDKFTKKIFRPQFDTRGYDNISGTADDVV